MPISEPTTNDYTELLRFLNSLDNIESTQKKKEAFEPLPEKYKKGSPQPIEKFKKNSSQVLVEEEEVRKTTKEIIEKSKSKEEKKSSLKKSAGFDVKKFESLMRAKLVDGYKKLQSYERPYISVTELVSCIRKTFYYRMKYSIDVKDLFKFPYVDIIQEVGNAIHTYVQTVYDFTEVNKTILSEKYKVKGRIDAYKDGYLCEIKTIDEDKFSNSFIPEHYDQGLIYSHIMNTEYDYSIHTITIIYVMRNNLRKIELFDIPMDENKAKSLLDRALILRSSLVKNVSPDPLGATMSQCSFCEFRKFCEKDSANTSKPYDASYFEKKIDEHVVKNPTFLL
jgi:hypothetical protein